MNSKNSSDVAQAALDSSLVLLFLMFCICHTPRSHITRYPKITYHQVLQDHISPGTPRSHITRYPKITYHQVPQDHISPGTPRSHITRYPKITYHQVPQDHISPGTPRSHIAPVQLGNLLCNINVMLHIIYHTSLIRLVKLNLRYVAHCMTMIVTPHYITERQCHM